MKLSKNKKGLKTKFSKKVMIFGTFDMVHQGHINLFAQAKTYGDYLIAVIARDKTVKELKEKKPKKNEKQRIKNIRKYVDKAVLGNIKDKFAAIKKYKPDVICLGYDQTLFTDALKFEIKKLKLKTKIVRLSPFKAHVYKSSLLMAKAPVRK